MSDRIYYSEDSKMQAQRKRTLLTIVTFIVGISVGSLITLLFTNDTDVEHLRERTENRIQKIEHQIQELSHKAKERIGELT